MSARVDFFEQYYAPSPSEAYLPGVPILLSVQVVSTAFTRALVKGDKGQRNIERIQIDTDVFFTILPSEILFEIGAYPEDLKARLELEQGDSVEARVFSVVVSTHGREDVTLAVTFEGAHPVLGAKFLEDLGLEVDSESGALGRTRHRGFAYNYEP
jgi:predicted aspartyl protease